jgi:phytoene synthase
MDELREFNLSEEDIAKGKITTTWRLFMQFQIERVRQLYIAALPGVRLLDPDGRFAIAAAGELYQGILDEIEASGYDIFNQRAHLSARQKFVRLPAIWYRARNSRY